MSEITVSVIKADVGGYVGHSAVHPEQLACAGERLDAAIKEGMLIDAQVGHVGDDIALIMSHKEGVDDEGIHKFAWDTFVEITEVSKRLKLYGAGQDLLADAFSGNVKGMGPGCAEFSFIERKSEPLFVFLADKTEPGAWNLPLFRMFADPFCTAGLVIDPNMHDGFEFEIQDVYEHKKIRFSLPEEMYDMLVFIGAQGRYVIKHVYRKGGEEAVAVTSTDRLNLMAGKYVGKDDPVLMVRSQSGLPAVGEVLEPFAFPHLVAGWMRGSHHGPLMPVAIEEAHPTRFDGPPRVVCYGYQLADGKFVGPRDMFADPSFDNARRMALDITDYMRRMGPFEPQRLSLDDMEYTTLPNVMSQLKDRFVDLEGANPVGSLKK
jgi:fructose 1,6-bisphosphate aldolase/phosphatase